MSKKADALFELKKLKYDIVVDLYRQKARFLAARSKGLESRIYKIFGTNLVGSLGAILDPYWQFVHIQSKGSKSKIISTLFPITPVPVNRTRYMPAILASKPGYSEHVKSEVLQNHLIWTGSSFVVSGLEKQEHKADYSGTIGVQNKVDGFIKDTTWKSRNPHSKRKIRKKDPKVGLQSQGEYELFVPRLITPGSHWGFQNQDWRAQQEWSPGLNLFTISHAWANGSFSPHSCVVIDSTVKNWPVSEKSYAQGLMAKHLDTLMAQCVPDRKYFNLAYQISELKDIPMMLEGTVKSWLDLERHIGLEGFTKANLSRSWWTKSRAKELAPYLKRVGIERPLDKQLGDLYLNFKFGWQSCYQAVINLANKPQHVTKEINYLIRRNGKFTNLSRTIGWTEDVAAFPSFIIPSATVALAADTGASPSYIAKRKLQMRCMCNVGVYFPPLSTPSFKKQLFFEKLGLLPTPGDLYDLIPWTWMLDWFVGLGDYIHLMDVINGDNTLINYGFMSYKSVTQVDVKWGMKYTSTVKRNCTPPDPAGTWSTDITTVNKVPFGSRIEMKYELRNSLSTLASVRTYSGSGLSSTQNTILAALFTKF